MAQQEARWNRVPAWWGSQRAFG